MNSFLNGVLIVASICFFLFIVNMIRTKRLELKYALTWLLTSLSFVIMAVFPGTLFFLARVLHIELPVNALFLSVIFLLLLIVFALTVAVSRQATRIKKLVQEMGLLKEEMHSRDKEQ